MAVHEYTCRYHWKRGVCRGVLLFVFTLLLQRVLVNCMFRCDTEFVPLQYEDVCPCKGARYQQSRVSACTREAAVLGGRIDSGTCPPAALG